MNLLIKSDDRGNADHGWLRSRHSFSFADYYEPTRMGFGCLRVINEDRVAPGQGFGTHAHRDMEILSYVLSGELAHKDSLGTGSVIRSGDLQRMTAGTGVTHSEFNASQHAPVHFLQIWLLPEHNGLPPGYEQKTFPPGEQRNSFRLIASRDGREQSITVHQDVELYAASVEVNATVTHSVRDGRIAWIQIVAGKLQVDGQQLEAGDGLGIRTPATLRFTGIEAAELLLFDMPG